MTTTDPIADGLRELGFTDIPRRVAAGDRLVQELLAHIAAGGKPNPPARFRTADYGLGSALNNARTGVLVLTDEQKAILTAKGVRLTVARPMPAVREAGLTPEERRARRREATRAWRAGMDADERKTRDRAHRAAQQAKMGAEAFHEHQRAIKNKHVLKKYRQEGAA